jgi:hypothetical protein
VCSAISLLADMLSATPEERPLAWIESFAMFAAVAIVCLFTAWQDSSKEAQFLENLKIEENAK